MYTRGSVRRKNKEVFQKVVMLRKQGYSYSEITKETGIAKTTINNWITFAGLNLSPEHLQIQLKKKSENHVLGTIASRETRVKKRDLQIQEFITKLKKYFIEPFFNYGIALFESEGSKTTDCKFSNSDYRVVLVFVKFIEKYIKLNRQDNIKFSLYLHESRRDDLKRITNFWANKLKINKSKIFIYWKRNKIVGRRENLDYLGQISLRVKGEYILGSKLLAVSGIILKKYLR